MSEEKSSKTEKPEWVKMKPQELQKIVLDLHKEGHTPAKIGLLLRDKHGIPKAKLLGKKITEIIKDSKQQIVNESHFIKKKIETLEKHFAKNKHDYPASRSIAKMLCALKRAEKLEKAA